MATSARSLAPSRGVTSIFCNRSRSAAVLKTVRVKRGSPSIAGGFSWTSGEFSEMYSRKPRLVRASDPDWQLAGCSWLLLQGAGPVASFSGDKRDFWMSDRRKAQTADPGIEDSRVVNVASTDNDDSSSPSIFTAEETDVSWLKLYFI